MVFIIDDILEDFAIGSVLLSLSNFLFPAIEATVTTATSFFQGILSSTGISALENIITSAPEIVDPMEITEEIKNFGITLFEDVEHLVPEASKLNFVENAAVIAKNLLEKGYNLATVEGYQFFKSIVEHSLNLVKFGAKKIVSPKLLIPLASGALGVVGAKKLYEKFENVVKNPEKLLEGKKVFKLNIK